MSATSTHAPPVGPARLPRSCAPSPISPRTRRRAARRPRGARRAPGRTSPRATRTRRTSPGGEHHGADRGHRQRDRRGRGGGPRGARSGRVVAVRVIEGESSSSPSEAPRGARGPRAGPPWLSGGLHHTKRERNPRPRRTRGCSTPASPLAAKLVEKPGSLRRALVVTEGTLFVQGPGFSSIPAMPASSTKILSSDTGLWELERQLDISSSNFEFHWLSWFDAHQKKSSH